MRSRRLDGVACYSPAIMGLTCAAEVSELLAPCPPVRRVGPRFAGCWSGMESGPCNRFSRW